MYTKYQRLAHKTPDIRSQRQKKSLADSTGNGARDGIKRAREKRK